MQNLMEEDDTSSVESLDISWLEEFERTDKDYATFYTDDVTNIRAHYVYINSSNEIEHIKEETILLNSPNCLTREEVLGILKRNMDSAKYSVLSILRYNIDIEPTELKLLLNPEHNQPYLTPLTNIDTIHFNKTIHMFQDLNGLYFLFVNKKHTTNAATAAKLTKRLRAFANKTTRKRFKELL